MKCKEPKSMEEIHKIREKIYYETKGMNIREKLEIIGMKAKSLKSKYNLKLRTPTKKITNRGGTDYT